MKEQSKKKQILLDIFVLRPWGFVLFLILGIVMFMIVSVNIKIPVYMTVETYAKKENDRIKLPMHNQKIQTDEPIFLYHARDESLEKITAYQLKDGYIVVKDTGLFSDGEKVNIDVQTEEITLLKHIFAEGGNI